MEPPSLQEPVAPGEVEPPPGHTRVHRLVAKRLWQEHRDEEKAILIETKRARLCALQSERAVQRTARDIAHLTQSEPDEAPGWAAAIHPSHELITYAGVVACIRCACQATLGCKPRLANICRGDHPKGSDRDVKLLLQGKMPASLKRWPDEAPAKMRRITRIASTKGSGP